MTMTVRTMIFHDVFHFITKMRLIPIAMIVVGAALVGGAKAAGFVMGGIGILWLLGSFFL